MTDVSSGLCMEDDVTRVRRYRAYASGLIDRAATIRFPDVRADFLRLAAEYEKLAGSIERRFRGRFPRWNEDA